MLEKFPTPTTAIEPHIINDEIPIKVLFQSKHIKNSPYSLLKDKVDILINAQVDIFSRAEIQSKTLPETIHISSPSSSHSEKDSYDTKVIEKMSAS